MFSLKLELEESLLDRNLLEERQRPEKLLRSGSGDMCVKALVKSDLLEFFYVLSDISGVISRNMEWIIGWHCKIYRGPAERQGLCQQGLVFLLSTPTHVASRWHQTDLGSAVWRTQDPGSNYLLLTILLSKFITAFRSSSSLCFYGLNPERKSGNIQGVILDHDL